MVCLPFSISALFYFFSLPPFPLSSPSLNILIGLWVVDSKWLLESASAGKWKPEEKYEATSRLSGTNTSRLSHKKSKTYSPLFFFSSSLLLTLCVSLLIFILGGFKNLFEGVAFYHKHSQIERSEFDDLVRSCGGSVCLYPLVPLSSLLSPLSSLISPLFSLLSSILFFVLLPHSTWLINIITGRSCTGESRRHH